MLFNPGCLCCEPGACCDDCPVRPAQYTVPVAGVTGTLTDMTLCTDCADFINDTYTITEDSDCVWLYGGPVLCDESSSYVEENVLLITGVRLFCFDDIWYLDVGITYHSTVFFPNARHAEGFYSLPRASWNCLGANTLNFLSSLGPCTNWPATITVTPV